MLPQAIKKRLPKVQQYALVYRRRFDPPPLASPAAIAAARHNTMEEEAKWEKQHHQDLKEVALVTWYCTMYSSLTGFLAYRVVRGGVPAPR